MENDGLKHIMSWQSSGRSFKIHNQQLLETEVLRMYFTQTKYASFQRQLNIYGFVRISSGADKGGYYHSMFLRDRPELASQIPREKVNKTGAKSQALRAPVAGVQNSNETSHERETAQLVSQLFPMFASPSFVASNLSPMSRAPVSSPPPIANATSNLGLLSSLMLSPNTTTALSNLCASRIGQELLSLLSQPTPQLPHLANAVIPSVNQIPVGLLRRSAPDNAALLELLLRSEGTGTNINENSILSAAEAHFRNLLNNNNNAQWPHPRQSGDRP